MRGGKQPQEFKPAAFYEFVEAEKGVEIHFLLQLNRMFTAQYTNRTSFQSLFQYLSYGAIQDHGF